MPVRVKTQKDYLVTEVSVELPCELNDLDYLMKTSRATGKIVAVYCDGGVSGINVEQRTKIPEPVAVKVRGLVGIADKMLEGK
jgi:hypothetical protein